MSSELLINLLTLLLFAFCANIPLGYLRETSPRFSVRWFVLIHLSIPFIVALRYHMDFGWSVVPFSVVLAIAGQFLGAAIRKRNVPQ